MILISNNVKIQKISPGAHFGGAKYRNLIERTLQKSKQTNNQTVIRETNQ